MAGMTEQEARVKGKTPWGCLALIAAPVLLMGGCFAATLTSDPSTGDPIGEVLDACRDAVTAQLRAPSTADFPDDERYGTSGDRYTVRGSVDAQNAFGAQIRTAWVCTATHTDGHTSDVSASLVG